MNRLSANFFMLFVLLVSACQKPSNLGLNILPENDLLNVVYSDSTTLITHTVLDDSLNTKNAPSALLGSYNDPIFGKVAASFYTQVNLKNTNNNFGSASDLVCDSIVLSLVYKSIYGGTEQQTVRVYELIQALSQDTNYYSYSNAGDYSLLTDIGTKTFVPNVTDSVIVDGKKLNPQLRIQMNNSLGQNFLAESGTANIASNTTFKNFFKGIYVKTSNGSQSLRKGAVLNFSLSDLQSGITVYYRNTNTLDTGKFELLFSGEATNIHFNHIDHDYSGAAQIQSQLSASDSVQTNSIYVQGLAGVKAKIYMPFLNQYKKSGAIAINKAELVLKVDVDASVDAYPVYDVPVRLFVEAVDSTGGFYLLPDIYLEGESFFGGIYDAANNVYKFNIARHVQDLMNGKKDYGFFIVPVSGGFNANRVVIGGGGSTGPLQMKLNLVYTKLY